MKHNLPLIIGFLAFCLIAHNKSSAQESIKIGIKGGLNIANIRGGSSSVNNSVIGGLHAGAYMNMVLAKKMGIAVELLYSQMGTITKESPAPNYYVHINYIEVPIMFTYEFFKGFTGQIGLGISTPVQAYKHQGPGPTDYFINQINKVVFSLPIGIVYEFDNGLNFGARGDLGLSPIGGDGAKNYVFMLSVGYSFCRKEK